MSSESVLTIPYLSRTKKCTGFLEVPRDCLPACVRCLRQHIKDLENSANEIISFLLAADSSDWMHWEAEIQGPMDTPYENAVFVLDIHFSSDYPFKPPHIKFKTKVFHPNISSKGEICSDSLLQLWNPVITLETILLSIVSFLTDPNPDDFLAPEAGFLYKSNLEQYNQKAKEWTRMYAMPLIDLNDRPTGIDISLDQIVQQETTDNEPIVVFELGLFYVSEALGTKTFDSGESKQVLSIVANCMKPERYHPKILRKRVDDWQMHQINRVDRWQMYQIDRDDDTIFFPLFYCNVRRSQDTSSQHQDPYSKELFSFLTAWIDNFADNDDDIYQWNTYNEYQSLNRRLFYSQAFRNWVDDSGAYEDRQNIANDLLSLAFGLEEEGCILEKQKEAGDLITELCALIPATSEVIGLWCTRLYSMPTFLFSQLNQFLREAVYTKLETYGPFVRFLCAYFDHPSSIEVHSIEVYRGMNLLSSMIDAYKERTLSRSSFRWAGFTSTSKDRRVAEHFDANTLFILQLKKTYPKEKKAIDINEHSSLPIETEVLLKVGVEFTVERVEYDSETKKHCINLNAYI